MVKLACVERNVWRSHALQRRSIRPNYDFKAERPENPAGVGKTGKGRLFVVRLITRCRHVQREKVFFIF